MQERRWPWVVASILLLASAAAAAASTYLHWLPCRGTLLSGSLIRGYQYGPNFSDACLRRMDAGLPFLDPPEPSEQVPWTSDPAVMAMVLAATAWLILALGMKWSLRTKAVAVLPGLATLALAATAAADHSPHDYVSGLLLVAPEAAALAALAAIWHWQPEIGGRGFVRVLIVAWGTTAFGFVHLIAEFFFMISFSDANWDVPPLTGSVTVATLTLSAVLTLLLTLRSTKHPASGRKEQAHTAHLER